MKYINTLYTTYELQLSGFNFSLLNLLSIIAILTAILVILSKNPIISVLYLIGLFVGMAIYLVSVGISFLGISYLLVYVGAVSILFLFILMLINVRISELLSDTNNTIPLIVVTTLVFSLLASDININTQYMTKVKTLVLDMFTNLFNNNYVQHVSSFSWENTISGLNHINSIGNMMYSSHNILLLQVSLILLLAMVGAIVITIKPVPKGKLPVLQAKPGINSSELFLGGRGAYDTTNSSPKPRPTSPPKTSNSMSKISFISTVLFTVTFVFVLACSVYLLPDLDIVTLVHNCFGCFIEYVPKNAHINLGCLIEYVYKNVHMWTS